MGRPSERLPRSRRPRSTSASSIATRAGVRPAGTQEPRSSIRSPGRPSTSGRSRIPVTTVGSVAARPTIPTAAMIQAKVVQVDPAACGNATAAVGSAASVTTPASSASAERRARMVASPPLIVRSRRKRQARSSARHPAASATCAASAATSMIGAAQLGVGTWVPPSIVSPRMRPTARNITAKAIPAKASTAKTRKAALRAARVPSSSANWRASSGGAPSWAFASSCR